MKILIAAILICMQVYTAPLFATDAEHAPIHTLDNRITEVPGSGMGNQNTTFPQARDTTNKQELLDQLRQSTRGTLRVTVTYAVDYDRRTVFRNETSAQAQRQVATELHEQFLRKIEGLNISGINPSQFGPRISFSVDEEALKYLFTLSMVDYIRRVNTGTTSVTRP